MIAMQTQRTPVPTDAIQDWLSGIAGEPIQIGEPEPEMSSTTGGFIVVRPVGLRAGLPEFSCTLNVYARSSKELEERKQGLRHYRDACFGDGGLRLFERDGLRLIAVGGIEVTRLSNRCYRASIDIRLLALTPRGSILAN
jgi:hypothetical protein